jgi:hypothetical protein
VAQEGIEAAVRIRFEGCAHENLNTGVVVMKSAQDGA